MDPNEPKAQPLRYMMRTKLLTGLVLAGILAMGGVAAAGSHQQVSGTPTPPPTDVCDFQGEQTDASTNPACDTDEQTPDSTEAGASTSDAGTTVGDTQTGDQSDPDMNSTDSNAMSGDHTNMGQNDAAAPDQNENDQSGEQD